MGRSELLEQFMTEIQGFGKRIAQQAFYHLGGRFSPTQYGLLMLLARHESISITKLAELLQVTPSAVTQQVESLVKSGLAVRLSNPDDRRQVYVALSDPGKEVMKRGRHGHLNRMNQMLECLTDEELEQFVYLVQKIMNYQAEKGNRWFRHQGPDINH